MRLEIQRGDGPLNAPIKSAAQIGDVITLSIQGKAPSGGTAATVAAIIF